MVWLVKAAAYVRHRLYQCPSSVINSSSFANMNDLNLMQNRNREETVKMSRMVLLCWSIVALLHYTYDTARLRLDPRFKWYPSHPLVSMPKLR